MPRAGDSILRSRGAGPDPASLFPSTFTCAIEEFSAFLVQFLGGEGEATQRRWWLSLQESHARFSLGPRERNAWLRAMTATLQDESLIADAAVREELLAFFRHSSAHVVNKGTQPSERPLTGELAPLWNEQLALDEAVAILRVPDKSRECIKLLQSPLLQDRFARSPAVHASFLALAVKSGAPLLREYAAGQIRAHPALVRERYTHRRTLLHDTCAAGDLGLVEQLLAMGAAETTDDGAAPSPLYCVGNECSAPGASRIVQILVQSNPAWLDAPYGVKRCTALHMAARRGNVEVIGALLDAGAGIEVRDSMGETPLRRAVNCNQVEAAKLLLARGADPRSKCRKARTPASAARSNQMKQLFEGESA